MKPLKTKTQKQVQKQQKRQKQRKNRGRVVLSRAYLQHQHARGYDGLDRLTSAVSPMYGTASYGYDVLDNLTRVVAPGRNHQYLYDARQRLTNVTSGGASVIGLGYDVQGNLQNKNGQAYSFDTGNRLRGASGLESYRYDGEGRRIQTTSAANVPIYWVYGQNGQLLYERDERTGRRLQYVYLGGSLVAQHSRPIGTDTLTMLYYHTDALGTPVALTDSTGTVQQRSEYEAYGRLLNRTSNNRPGYTGHVEDAATGLTYMQQRYYDPGIGRFLSVDPVTANSGTGANFNRYKYAANNPYRFTDPDGRYSCELSVCKAVSEYVGKLKNSRDNLKNSGDRKNVNNVLKQIGSKGDGKGPHYVSAELKGKTMASTDQQGTTKIDVNKIQSSKDPGVEGARSIAHEAQHDIDSKNGAANTEATVRAAEQNAYKTEASTAKGLGVYLSPEAQEKGVDGSVENWKARQEKEK